MGLALGVSLASATRSPRRHRRTRAFLIPLGLNLAALALLGAILASGLEEGGMALRWSSWWWPGLLALLVSTLALRFPKAFGLPVVALSALLTWQTARALEDFRPLMTGEPELRVQPMTDRETVTVFSLRADVLSVEGFSGRPWRWYRLRSEAAPPSEWWWAWASSQGWARSTGAAIPEKPFKYGVYRLMLSEGYPVWQLEKPELLRPRFTP